MRTIQFSPGTPGSKITFTYKSPGTMTSIGLLSRIDKPKQMIDGLGVGEKKWLVHTPFYTVEMCNPEGREFRALLAIDSDTEAAEVVMSRVPTDHACVAVSEDDAMFVADLMRLPMIIITARSAEEGYCGAIFRDPSWD